MLFLCPFFIFERLLLKMNEYPKNERLLFPKHHQTLRKRKNAATKRSCDGIKSLFKNAKTPKKPIKFGIDFLHHRLHRLTAARILA